MNYDYLLHKIQQIGIDGSIYRAVKVIGWKNLLVEVYWAAGWQFSVNSGVRQVDSLSPTPFAIFINALPKELHQSGKGIVINEVHILLLHILLLMYADDIVILLNNYEDTQYQMDILVLAIGFESEYWKILSNKPSQPPEAQISISY